MKTIISKACMASIFSTSLLSVTVVNANDIQSLPYAAGDFEILARLDTTLGYGDNVFRGSFVEQGSTFLNVLPTVSAVKENASHRLAFTYEGEGALFFESSEDGYISTQLGAEYVAKFSPTSELGFGLSYEDGNSVRGTDILEGSNSTIDGPSEFEDWVFKTNYYLGSDKIGPILELDFEYSDLKFQNFSFFTEGRDRTSTSFSARLGYQYSVATQFFVDLGYTDFDYDGVINGFGASLDNDEQKIEVGVKWRATRQTSGEISVGVTDKDFDSFGDTSSVTSWNAQIEWNPTSRDKVVFNSFSRPFEQNGTGLFIDVQEASVSWDRKISPRWGFNVGLSAGKADFEANVRDDDYESYDLGVTYKPNRFSALSLDYKREDKDSASIGPIFDFDSNTISLTYSTSL